MKRGRKIFLFLLLCIIAGSSFMVGSYLKEREQLQIRANHCKSLISFAIDKTEKQGILDADTISAIASNLYAAYHYCDDSILAAEIHELWNTLLFREDDYVGKEDELILKLKSLLERLKYND